MIRIAPVVLSFIILAAHFLRAGHLPLVVLCLLLPVLAWIRKPWVPWVLGGILVVGSAEWIRTLLLVTGRLRAMGVPWERSAWILGGVAAFTLLSVVVFRTGTLRERYAGIRRIS